MVVSTYLYLLNEEKVMSLSNQLKSSKKKTAYVLLLLLFASCYVQGALTDALLGTYYYPWHSGSNEFHNNGGIPGYTTLVYHLDPQVLPALGWYSQEDSDTISRHYQWADYAGIDFFVCSYWGINRTTDRVIRNYMFDNPDRGDIKLCVFMEPPLTTANGASVAKMTAEMNHLCDNYFDRPGYFHIDGKPVIFIYVTRAMDNTEFDLCINTFRDVASIKGYDLYIVGDEVWKEANTSIDGPRMDLLDGVSNYDVYGNNRSTPYVTDTVLDTWQTRNAGWRSLAEDRGVEFIPAISPGYNDEAVRPNLACSRKLNNASNEFGTLFSGMIDRLDPDIGMVMVNSWNEWHEDTQIEPTTVSAPSTADDAGGYYTEGLEYEGYGMRYLNLLRKAFVRDEIPIGASASDDNPPGETADEAFDGDVNTKWRDFSMIANGSSYIQYRYIGGATATVTEYAITSANNAQERDPKDWDLLGSNDEGATWDVLDSRTGETFADRLQERSFSISGPASYNIYRLEITAVRNTPGTADSVQLAELELIGVFNPICADLVDLNCDLNVDTDDLLYMAGVWLTDDFTADIAQSADDIVNLVDYSVMARRLGNWLEDDSVAHWRLDDAIGTFAADASGSGYNGTLMNMEDNDWIVGANGHALDFDGTNDYVTTGSVCAAIAGGDITVSAWVKAPAVNSAQQFMISINTSTGDNRLLCGTQPNTATLSLGDTAWHNTTATVIDNTWHHIAYVIEDSADMITVYVDGSFTDSFTSTVSVAATDILSLGQEYDPPMETGDFYKGRLDDVRIYDYALNETQIRRLYDPLGLVAHWKLDEMTGILAADGSVNDYSGTLVNMDDSDWVPGNTGNALDFDGVNDYVVADSVCAAMAGGDVTVSAWIKAPATNPAIQFMIGINASNGNNRLLLGTQADSAKLSLHESGWHDTTATVIDNTWHHIAYVLEDSSDTITIYVDGSDVLSFTSTVSIADDDTLSLGQKYTGATPNYFYDGLLDEVRVYDRALSPTEIAILAQ